MSKTSKMIRFEPRIKDGVHHSYTGKFGTMFSFTVEFENGDIGEASSKSQSPKWQLGTVYNYDFETTQYGGKIKGMKKVEAEASGGGGEEYMTPQMQRRINMSVAYEIATDVMIGMIDSMDEKTYPAPMLKEAIEGIAITFCNWIMEDPSDSRLRCNALRRAYVQSEIKRFDIINREKIIERANEILLIFAK